MPYRNQPVVREGPFDVIVAFRLELNVVHAPRLQTNAEKGSPHATRSEPVLTAGPDQDGSFAAPPQSRVGRAMNLLERSFKKHPDKETFI